MDLLLPAAYSAAVSVAQVISTKIPLSVVETSVVRSAAVGVACVAFLAGHESAPSVTSLAPWVTALSVLSGVIMFFAAIAYISMCRRIGVVATAVTTTAFSFLFTTAAGAAMSEHVPCKTYVAIAVVMAALVIQKM
jgi:hypothetical protein